MRHTSVTCPDKSPGHKDEEDAANRLNEENMHSGKIDAGLANSLRDYKDYIHRVADAIRNQDYQRRDSLIQENIEFVDRINKAMKSAGYYSVQ